MVKVTFYRNSDKVLVGFKMDGHANYSEKGGDIVCSAVSMIGQATVNGLHEVAGIKVTFSMREGFLSCTIPKDLTAEQHIMAKAILGTMKVGLLNIKKNYSRYLYIDEEEV